jgi:hypothetical protein
MEREIRRKYPFEKLSTEELENLLAQDFAATDGAEPDVDYIMAIMEVINEREKAVGRQSDVDAAWKEFQNEYQGQAAAFDRTIQREAESSDHLKTSLTQVARKRTRVFRYMLVAAVLIVLLCGTASGFGRVFQAVVNWTAETFGFESPYGVELSVEVVEPDDVYADLRTAVAEHTDLPVIPKWAPEGTLSSVEGGVQKTERKDSMQFSGNYKTNSGEFVVRVMIHNEIPSQYTVAYQWNEAQVPVNHKVNGLNHEVVYNYENSAAAWTNENVECIIQGTLSEEELEKMIDSIYEE